MKMLFLVLLVLLNDKEGAHATQGCGSVVNNTLKSPGYPNNYPPNMDCNYTIPIQRNLTMNISFIDFELEDGVYWGYDYLEIIKDGRMVGQYYGRRTGRKIILNGDQILVKFHSNDVTEGRGFLIHFTAGPHGCGSVVNNILKSPGYPNNYLPNMDCSYTIPIPRNRTMNISFIDFVLEGSSPCYFDYLEIIKDGRMVGIYCSRRTGQNIVFNGDQILINFHSNNFREGRGFLIHFTAAPHGCGSVVNNTLKSPGYPNNYLTIMDCSYTIPIPRNRTMNISFIDFVLEGSSPCYLDYLEIIKDGRIVGKYCSRRTGQNIVLNGDQILINFHSNNFTEGRGFLIHFTAGPPGCGPVIENTLTSPRYPNDYPNNTDCISSVPIPQGTVINITINELYLEDSINCGRDYLQITNEMNRVFGKYCGHMTGKTLLVSGKYALIKFHSGRRIQNRGFLISFTSCKK